MKPIYQYEINQTIKDIELKDEQGKLVDIKHDKDICREDGEAYFKAFASMIQLEEVANSKPVIAYDLENVKLSLLSRKEKTFRIHHVSKHTAKCD